MEAELAATEARATSVNRRLYSGEVRASRELQALAADIDSLKARASDLEDQVLEIIEVREPLDARVADVTAQIGASRPGARSAARSWPRPRRSSTRAGAARRRRSRAGRGDPGRRAGHLRTAAGPARTGSRWPVSVGNHCDGCHLALPAVELDRIRHLPAQALVTCDHCGRILVR